MSNLGAARLRYARHYWGVLREIGRILADTPYHQQAIAQYEAESENIALALQWTSEADTDNIEWRTIAVEFGGAGANILMRRLPAPAQRALFGQLLAHARAAGKMPAVAVVADLLGLAHTACGDWIAAEALHREALELNQTLGEAERALGVWGHLGIALEGQSRFDEAKFAYDTQAANARALGDQLQEGRAIGNSALIAELQGRFADALDGHYKAHNLCGRAGNDEGVLRALHGIGTTSTELERFDEARAAFEAIISKTRTIADGDGLASALIALGRLDHLTGAPQKAIGHLKEALAIARTLSDPRAEGAALLNLANAFLAAGAPGSAETAADQRLSIARQMRDRWGEAAALEARGRARSDLADWDRASDDLREAEKAWTALNNGRSRAIAILHLGVALARQSLWAEALSYFDRALALAHGEGLERLAEDARNHRRRAALALETGQDPGPHGASITFWRRLLAHLGMGVPRSGR